MEFIKTVLWNISVEYTGMSSCMYLDSSDALCLQNCVSSNYLFTVQLHISLTLFMPIP